MNRPLPLPAALGLALLLALPAAVAPAQDLPGASPFVPAADRNGVPAGDTRYQLGGIINNGGKLMASITRLSNKQSYWIAVGETVGEITVLRCDPDKDQATIRAGSEQLTLTLRHPVVQAGTGIGTTAVATADVPRPDAAPTPPLPPPAGPPEVQEREARMLVSDLLDIGQQHRKAYEEAQRKAAAEKKQ